MIAKSIGSCRQLVTCDKTYFIHVHLLVLLHKFKFGNEPSCSVRGREFLDKLNMFYRSQFLINERC